MPAIQEFGVDSGVEESGQPAGFLVEGDATAHSSEPKAPARGGGPSGSVQMRQPWPASSSWPEGQQLWGRAGLITQTTVTWEYGDPRRTGRSLNHDCRCLSVLSGPGEQKGQTMGWDVGESLRTGMVRSPGTKASTPSVPRVPDPASTLGPDCRHRYPRDGFRDWMKPARKSDASPGGSSSVVRAGDS